MTSFLRFSDTVVGWTLRRMFWVTFSAIAHLSDPISVTLRFDGIAGEDEEDNKKDGDGGSDGTSISCSSTEPPSFGSLNTPMKIAKNKNFFFQFYYRTQIMIWSETMEKLKKEEAGFNETRTESPKKRMKRFYLFLSLRKGEFGEWWKKGKREREGKRFKRKQKPKWKLKLSRKTKKTWRGFQILGI